jgi:hypothetical protein
MSNWNVYVLIGIKNFLLIALQIHTFCFGLLEIFKEFEKFGKCLRFVPQYLLVLYIRNLVVEEII